MTNNKRFRIPSKLKMRFFIVPVCMVAMALCGLMLQYAGAFYLGRLSLGETSTNYRYSDTFNLTLSKYEKLNNIYLADKSFATPGLASTDILGDASCQMVPQGICMAGDYILISAYNSSAGRWERQIGASAQNSVIYILSTTGEYLNTMVLPDINHVGGLTFDGQNVWVAKSSKRSCSLIPYEAIELVAKGNEPSIPLENYLADLKCNRSASFITYHDNKLWIGTFGGRGKQYSEVGVYEIGSEEGPYDLTEVATLKLPAGAQGISFYEQPGVEYMIVSTSYGRIFNSVYYMFVTKHDQDNYILDYKGKCELPPMSEEFYSDGIYTYMMFESGATTYSLSPYFRCQYPVDRICVVENEGLIAMME